MVHDWFASRERILEHTLEAEAKFRASEAVVADSLRVLCFCMTTEPWRKDRLEDFVSFYKTGQHRADDALGSMEAHKMKQDDLSLSHDIDSFALMLRDKWSVRWSSLAWDIKPPPEPWKKK